MKILVVSLLRIGDLFMHSACIRGLKEQTQGQVDVLINDECVKAQPLMPYVSQFHVINRKQIQTSIGEKDRHALEGYFLIEKLIAKINCEKYDFIINLTNNKLSARLMDLFESPKKEGFQYDNGQLQLQGNSWVKYLNAFAKGQEPAAFHFVDIWNRALNLRPKFYPLALYQQTPPWDELDSLNIGGKPYICIQPLTSDAKKDWGLNRYKTLVMELLQQFPHHEIVVLSAPFEYAKVSAEFKDLQSSRLHVISVSFAAALYILKKCDLLITGDTSIKHLASSAGCRILEIIIGSSQYKETGAYSVGAVMLVSREACQPCGHSQDCFRSTHYCAQRIRPDIVADIAYAMLSNSESRLEHICRSQRKMFQAYRTRIDSYGLWHADGIGDETHFSNLKSQLGKIVWAGFLDGESANVQALAVAFRQASLSSGMSFSHFSQFIESQLFDGHVIQGYIEACLAGRGADAHQQEFSINELRNLIPEEVAQHRAISQGEFEAMSRRNQLKLNVLKIIKGQGGSSEEKSRTAP